MSACVVALPPKLITNRTPRKFQAVFFRVYAVLLWCRLCAERRCRRSYVLVVVEVDTQPQQLLSGVGEQEEEDKVRLHFEQRSFPARKRMFYIVSL